jgi:hypothetical protein
VRSFVLLLIVPLLACGSAPSSSGVPDGGFIPYGGDGGQDGSADAGLPTSYPLPDGGRVAGDRFITTVVSYDAGSCAGFGQSKMPDIVYGPPVGAGTTEGSFDVVSLGVGGSIVVSFAPNGIVDGPGVDFVVFENPFWIGGNANDVYAEPGIVSVSDDGITWTSFPCTATVQSPPYGTCAGWHPVLSAPGNGISPIDPSVSGGDGFDLSDIGVAHARYVRIVDHTEEVCPTDPTMRPDTDGFDLDAIAIINADNP